MRQIVLDTETTGLELEQGNRIIEIGCVELEGRRLTGRHYHQYVNPDFEVEEGAFEVHGISNEFLADKPRFPEIAADFWQLKAGGWLGELKLRGIRLPHRSPQEKNGGHAKQSQKKLDHCEGAGKMGQHYSAVDKKLHDRKMFPLCCIPIIPLLMGIGCCCCCCCC